MVKNSRAFRSITREASKLLILHGPPMLVDKTNFGLVLYNHLTFIGLRRHLVIGQLNEYQFFFAFQWSPATHFRRHCV